ncbi:uncharacterized protein LOC129594143 isoform X2 [Paramacrobiotus metropolitanus]|uniref:uncharacterized protein LOC129594143 isoform X2 n=1 Tax=Paramacrobiotus metropolitanus TaxID=2943436 RepID=UPI002445E2F7|nr:uncharacterized protein LOC129594143 isoform X2 [Paramacrobiotus metropolitanus]
MPGSFSLDDDWAVVDNALFMISNPDFQMSMPGTMTGSSMENNCHGMQQQQPPYSGPDSANILSQLPVDTQQRSASQQPISNANGYDYVDPSQQYYTANPQMQYMDHQHFPVEHFQMSAQNPMQNMNYYNPSNNVPDPFTHNSPMYYVAQSVQNIPGPEQQPSGGNHLVFNYENYASLPGAASARPNVGNNMAHVPPSRNRASSSGGNSPSSQSPVSEEEFSEPAPKPLSRRQSKDTVTAKKSKPSKPRRRKRDPNEPTKPVSAYALFFRDKQATIKGSKPDASFGEVSKIVASLWDSLDPEKKSMYKKRTEEAKKDYLQQLAIYRASLISSPSDTPLYIQTNYPSRSSPIQLAYMDSRQMYGSGNNLNTPYHVKSHPTQTNENPEWNQLRPLNNENGQIYGRVSDTELIHKNGNYISQMATVWDPSIMADDNGIVAMHCKDGIYQNDWAGHQQSPNNNHTKVVI